MSCHAMPKHVMSCGPFCPFVSQKGKRDHSWNHYHGSISAVPFGKRDHRTRHKRKRDHRNGVKIMAPTAVPFAFVCCSAVPFGKRDHRNGVKIMVPTAVPFGKRDHRGSAGQEHFGRSVLVCALRGPFWQKGPQCANILRFLLFFLGFFKKANNHHFSLHDFQYNI